MQCNAMQCNAMQCNAMQCNAMQCNAMQCNAMHCNALHCTALHCTALYLLYCTVLYLLYLLYSLNYEFPVLFLQTGRFKEDPACNASCSMQQVSLVYTNTSLVRSCDQSTFWNWSITSPACLANSVKRYKSYNSCLSRTYAFWCTCCWHSGFR